MSEKQKTNFEKWKQRLTPSNIIDSGCNNCPICWKCEEHWGTEACCLAFKRWANAEAKEEDADLRHIKRLEEEMRQKHEEDMK